MIRLRGTQRSDRTFNEPVPPKTPPEPPEWLDEAGQEVWGQLAPQLKQTSLLTILDVYTLARYCHILVRWRNAEEFIAQHGEVYPLKDHKGETRYLQQFRQVSIANKLAIQLTRMEAEFGMTPSARSRIHVDPQKIPGEQDEQAQRSAARFFSAG